MATLKKRKRRKYNGQRGGGLIDKFFSFFPSFGKGKSPVQDVIPQTSSDKVQEIKEEGNEGNGREGEDSTGGSKRRRNRNRRIGSRRRRSKKILVY